MAVVRQGGGDMKIGRIVKHLLTSHGAVKRAFPGHAFHAIEKAIKASEATHAGQVRFVVEAALDGSSLFKGQSARERAIEVFAQLHVWDTEYNNGLLIYLLLADRAVEIVADRGIHAKVGTEEWRMVCHHMETSFRDSSFESGVVSGVQEVTRHLTKHFPAAGPSANELPDKPVVL